MQSHLDCGLVKKVALGPVKLSWCRAKLMDPLMDAADPEALGKRGRADADGMALLCDPRSNTVAAAFIGAAAPEPFKKAGDGKETAPDFGLNLVDRNCVPVLLFEKEVASTELVC